MNLALIQAHHGVEATVSRHLPFWEASYDRVVFVTTKGSALKLPVEQIERGAGGHHGDELADRVVEMLEWALSQSWSMFGLFEYDAFHLAHMAPPLKGMSAIRYKQDNPTYWEGAFFLHYPHLYSREALAAIVPQLKAIRARGEVDTRYSDRFIGRAAELAGIPVQDLKAEKLGFSRDTITTADVPEMEKAVRKGAVAIHGVKTEDILAEILKAHASRSK